MKKTLLIVGIIALVIGIAALLWGALNRFMFYNIMDGSFSLYDRLHRTMLISFAVGAVSTVIGIVCLIVRRKM